MRILPLVSQSRRFVTCMSLMGLDVRPWSSPIWSRWQEFGHDGYCTAVLSDEGMLWLSGKTLRALPIHTTLQVKLPAEPEDHAKRPAYIKENSAGVAVCENRLQYLVHKGAIIRKG